MLFLCASALILSIIFWCFGAQRAGSLNISIESLANQTTASVPPFDLLSHFLEIYGDDGDKNSSVASTEEASMLLSTITHKKVRKIIIICWNNFLRMSNNLPIVLAAAK